MTSVDPYQPDLAARQRRPPRYRKRAWMAAVVLHSLIIGLVLVAYGLKSGQSHPARTVVKAALIKSPPTRSNLFSVASRAQAPKQAGKPKKQEAGQQPPLPATQQGSHADDRSDNSQKRSQPGAEASPAPSHQAAASSSRASIRRRAEGQHIREELAALSRQLYQRIQKQIKVTRELTGRIRLTLMPSGQVTDITVTLKPDDPALRLRLKKLVAAQSGQLDLPQKPDKPVTVAVPLAFE